MDMNLEELNLLEQRKIEAAIAAPILQGYVEKLGRSKALSIAMEVIEKLSRDKGRKAAREKGSQSLKDLAQIMKSWSGNGLLEEEIIEESETRYFFNVIRCRYAEVYESIGVKEFGYCLSCCRDQPFVEGFNPEIKFKRTQTIMEGAPHCDFRFSLDSKP